MSVHALAATVAGPRPLVVTEIHSDTEAHLTSVLYLDTDGMVVRRSPARTSVGRHIWVEFCLPPGRRVRRLARVVGRSAEVTRLAFQHFWPADRALYERYLKRQRVAA